ncbi:MAG: hypothetical protein HQL06_13020 [Nitrospirae bacterium]|nr:hypothetical protein [Nitrospirota bacterium]
MDDVKGKNTIIEEFKSVILEFYKKYNLDPDKFSNEDKTRWVIAKGNDVTYIDLTQYEEWESITFNTPILLLPEKNILPFYRKCLEVNNYMAQSALTVFKDKVFIHYECPLKNYTYDNLSIDIDRSFWTASKVADILANEFGCKKISDEPT